MFRLESSPLVSSDSTNWYTADSAASEMATENGKSVGTCEAYAEELVRNGRQSLQSSMALLSCKVWRYLPSFDLGKLLPRVQSLCENDGGPELALSTASPSSGVHA